jgi:hypothetical protein
LAKQSPRRSDESTRKALADFRRGRFLGRARHVHYRFASVLAVSGMGWEWALCFLGIGYVVISIAVIAFAKWHKNRYLRIPNAELNEHRITLKFTVGSDAK